MFLQDRVVLGTRTKNEVDKTKFIGSMARTNLPPEPKNSCWLLLWLVEDHTHTGNNIQKDVHTFMKQSYHVPIIRIVQQINEEMI